MSSTKAQLAKSSTYATFSTPKPTQNVTVPSTAELYRTLRLIPDSRWYSVTFLSLLLFVFSRIFIWVSLARSQLYYLFCALLFTRNNTAQEFSLPLSKCHEDGPLHVYNKWGRDPVAIMCKPLIFNSQFSSSRHSNRGRWQESSTIEDGDVLKLKNRVRCGDLSIFSLGEDENSLNWRTSSAYCLINTPIHSRSLSLLIPTDCVVFFFFFFFYVALWRHGQVIHQS